VSFCAGVLTRDRGSEHKTALCYLASLRFFWRIFLFVRLVQLFIFFNCLLKNQLISIEKIMCCKCVRYKKYDKKNGGQHHKGLEALTFRAVASPKPCLCVGGWVFISSQTDKRFIFLPIFFYCFSMVSVNHFVRFPLPFFSAYFIG
jgi:hypothetical protein